MDPVQIKEWLDKRVDSINEQKAIKDLNNQIRTDVEERVLVFQGIEIIADVIGIPLTKEIHEFNGIVYEYSFVYRGIKFNSFCRARLSGFEEAEQC